MTFAVGDSGHTTEHNRLAGVVTAGAVVAPAGTVSAPGITSVTDTTTGMYFDSAGVMRFTSGGTLTFAVQAGIWTMSSGTASRPYLLLTNTTTDATSGSMYFRKDPSDDAISTGDSLGTIWFQGVNTAGGAVTGAQVKGEADGANNASGVPGRLVFLTSNGTTLTERMRIDSSGNVGIGASPGTRLDVATAGSAQGETGLSIRNPSAADYGYTSIVGYANGNAQAELLFQRTGTTNNGQFGIRTRNGGSLTERLTIDSAGLITGTGTSLGAWTSYTPTLGGTGWAIGNGTASGAYCLIGKTVHFWALIIFGSTSTFGASADPTVTLPVTAKSGDGIVTIARTSIGVELRDNSAAKQYQAGVWTASTTTLTLRYLGVSGDKTAITSTAPFTWQTDDTIRVSGMYEAA